MENKILDLWPTSILKKTFDEHNNCKKDLISFIDNYKKDFPNGRSGNENKDLYESNYDIFSFANSNSSLLKLIEFSFKNLFIFFKILFPIIIEYF